MIATSREAFRQGSRLSVEDFDRIFDEQWDLMSRRFFKFEGLQYYDEGPESVLVPYLAGRFSEFAERLKSARSEDSPFFASARDRGVEFYRVHAVEHPFTAYLEAEFYSYILSEQLGETILCVSRAELDQTETYVPDFLLFDNKLALVHEYDQRGTRKGGWCIDDPSAVAIISQVSEWLIQKGTPFKQHFEGIPEILAMLL